MTIRLLQGCELEEVIKYMNIATKIAGESPCAKEKRGVVIVNQGKIVGEGVNSPPMFFKCEPNYCGESCRVPAVHAEMNAIIDAGRKRHNLNGARMYHARVENGVLQDSREPRCADCSKHILQANICDFVLKHKTGFTLYDAVTFHYISLKNSRKEILSGQK